MRRKLLLLGWAVVLTAIMGTSLYVTKGVSNADTDSRPNVIVFFTDDMRLDEMKYMPKTRKLIGQQGATFDRWYSNNPLCCPFRASALDGRYTHNNRVLGNTPETNGGVQNFDDTKTIAPHLQQEGYKTAYIGKYLNGYNLAGEGNIPPGWDEWFVPIRNIYSYYDTVMNHNGDTKEKAEYVTDVYAEETNNTIRNFSATGDPFVMYVSHLAPHGTATKEKGFMPIPPARYRGAVDTTDVPPIRGEKNVSDKPAWIRRLPAEFKNPEKILASKARRAETLMAVDDAVASMVQTLIDTDQLDNTIIMFTSDNGFMRGEHRIGTGKVVPYEESAHMPMMIRGPGFAAGTTRSDAAGTVDIVPTIMDLTGATVPYPVDGRSIVKPDMDRKILLEGGPQLHPGVWSNNLNQRSYVGVVDRYYKYIVYWNGERELYPMTGTRDEQRSLIDPRTNRVQKEHKQALQPYRQALERLRDCQGASCIFP